MNETLIASLFYFAVFAGIGYSRGLRREIMVLGITGLVLGALFLVQNRAHALIWSAMKAGWDTLPTWPEIAPGVTWMDSRRHLQDSPFQMALWLSANGTAYWYTQARLKPGKKPRRMLGAAISICNGALFLNLVIPLLGRSLSWPGFDVLPTQAPDFAVRASSLMDLAIANRSVLLTVLAIAILIYFVSRRRQPDD